MVAYEQFPKKSVTIGLSGGNGMMIRAFASLIRGNTHYEVNGVWRSSIDGALESLAKELGDRFLKQGAERDEELRVARETTTAAKEERERYFKEGNELRREIQQLREENLRLRERAREERRTLTDELIQIVENLRET